MQGYAPLMNVLCLRPCVLIAYTLVIVNDMKHITSYGVSESPYKKGGPVSVLGRAR